jgi:hypothetical protein
MASLPIARAQVAVRSAHVDSPAGRVKLRHARSGRRIDDKPGVGTTDRDPVQIREPFTRGVGVRKDVNAG